MSVNNYRPHIIVVPEDDANRQIVNGFLLESGLNARKIQVQQPAGGWPKVLAEFKNNQIGAMSKYADRYIVLLIDFDADDMSVNSEGVERRFGQIQEAIPEAFAERVFVLGALGEPEQLRQAGLGSFEKIGNLIARDCRDKTTTTWQHPLLKHNMAELNRAYAVLRPILFPND